MQGGKAALTTWLLFVGRIRSHHSSSGFTPPFFTRCGSTTRNSPSTTTASTGGLTGTAWASDSWSAELTRADKHQRRRDADAGELLEHSRNKIAVERAREAGGILNTHSRQDRDEPTIERKAQQRRRRRSRGRSVRGAKDQAKRFPGHAIIAEKAGHQAGTEDYIPGR